MDSCNFTNEANSHAFEVEIYTLQKLCHFGRYDSKAKLFCQKSFVPVVRIGVFIWENFHPGYRDLGRKNRDLGNRASPASHMNTSKFLRRKEWRGEIRASPVDRAHMKRPLVMLRRTISHTHNGHGASRMKDYYGISQKFLKPRMVGD